MYEKKVNIDFIAKDADHYLIIDHCYLIFWVLIISFVNLYTDWCSDLTLKFLSSLWFVSINSLSCFQGQSFFPIQNPGSLLGHFLCCIDVCEFYKIPFVICHYILSYLSFLKMPLLCLQLQLFSSVFSLWVSDVTLKSLIHCKLDLSEDWENKILSHFLFGFKFSQYDML